MQKSPVSKCRVKTQDHEPHLGPPNNFENCERPINLNVQSYWGKKTGGQKLILIGKKRNSWCYKPSICLSYPWLQLGRNSPCSSKAENKLSYRTPSASPVKTSPFHPSTLSSSLQIHPTSTSNLLLQMCTNTTSLQPLAYFMSFLQVLPFLCTWQWHILNIKITITLNQLLDDRDDSDNQCLAFLEHLYLKKRSLPGENKPDSQHFGLNKRANNLFSWAVTRTKQLYGIPKCLIWAPWALKTKLLNLNSSLLLKNKSKWNKETKP